MHPRPTDILATSVDAPYFTRPFDLAHLDAQRPGISPYSSTGSDVTIQGDHYQDQTTTSDTVNSSEQPQRPVERVKVKKILSQEGTGTDVVKGKASMATNEPVGGTTAGELLSAAARPKRVRTGCLTCRERHLKCDEGLPDCLNCRKSSRACKRGVRLNFIDTQVKSPPITPPTQEWDIVFQDESREIASEYRGGLGRYAAFSQESEDIPDIKDEALYQFSSGVIKTPTLSHQQLPSLQPSLPGNNVDSYPTMSQRMPDNSREQRMQSSSNTDSTFASQTIPPPPQSAYNNSKQTLTPPSEGRGALDSPEELLFMQVFVEEVGLWMDSLDPYKHVG